MAAVAAIHRRCRARRDNDADQAVNVTIGYARRAAGSGHRWRSEARTNDGQCRSSGAWDNKPIAMEPAMHYLVRQPRP
jgi:hypothetical protein